MDSGQRKLEPQPTILTESAGTQQIGNPDQRRGESPETLARGSGVDKYRQPTHNRLPTLAQFERTSQRQCPCLEGEKRLLVAHRIRQQIMADSHLVTQHWYHLADYAIRCQLERTESAIHIQHLNRQRLEIPQLTAPLPEECGTRVGRRQRTDDLLLQQMSMQRCSLNRFAFVLLDLELIDPDYGTNADQQDSQKNRQDLEVEAPE